MKIHCHTQAHNDRSFCLPIFPTLSFFQHFYFCGFLEIFPLFHLRIDQKKITFDFSSAYIFLLCLCSGQELAHIFECNRAVKYLIQD